MTHVPPPWHTGASNATSRHMYIHTHAHAHAHAHAHSHTHTHLYLCGLAQLSRGQRLLQLRVQRQLGKAGRTRLALGAVGTADIQAAPRWRWRCCRGCRTRHAVVPLQVRLVLVGRAREHGWQRWPAAATAAAGHAGVPLLLQHTPRLLRCSMCAMRQVVRRGCCRCDGTAAGEPASQHGAGAAGGPLSPQHGALDAASGDGMAARGTTHALGLALVSSAAVVVVAAAAAPTAAHEWWPARGAGAVNASAHNATS
jgi:hypothetical protein